VTKADKQRFTAFRDIGCVACRIWGRFSEADVHHLLSGGRRRGHRYTVPLCPWHHRGEPGVYIGVKDMEKLAGPSLARTPRKFRETYGDDRVLLAYTDALLSAKRAQK
jgi:hypothetical protein